jgi:hypothetical protein
MTACIRCGAEFVKASGVQKYCTRECLKKATSEAHKLPVRDAQCKGCGNSFQAEGHRTHFCSSTCRVAHFNSRRPTTQAEFRDCVVCGTKFQPMQKRGIGRQWCSEICYHVSKGRVGVLSKMPNVAKETLAKASRVLRESNLKSGFGLSIDAYDAMFAGQSGVCAICKRPENAKSSGDGSPRALAVDHDHKTGKVRALLCSACNTSLGGFQDNPAYLQAAIEYLKEHSDGVEEANDD